MHRLRKGLSLIEIMVSTVILAVILAGLANLFVVGKRHIIHNRAKMTGGELGKFFLDDYQMYVRQDQWGDSTNCLGDTPNTSCDSRTSGAGLDRDYTAVYQYYPTSTEPEPLPYVNRVKVKIQWTEE